MRKLFCMNEKCQLYTKYFEVSTFGKGTFDDNKCIFCGQELESRDTLSIKEAIK